MSDRLAHRGPDGSGLVARDAIVFGHRRLAIIDTSAAGTQPMYDSGGAYLITYNGEIYNYLDLRRELTSRGSSFASRTDTEVILEAYKQWGPACVDRLNGMFAFAIWDAHSKSLFMARDRLGKKPLFYRRTDKELSFASELTALLQDDDTPDAVNERAIIQYLAIGYITGDECIHPRVEKLPPATWFLWEQGRSPVIERYWNLAHHFLAKEGPPNERAAIDRLNGLLEDAVRIRLMSDVPLGAFLSGGIDSASIVAHLRRQRGNDLTHTFSAGFNEPSFSELKEAEFTSKSLDVLHHQSTIVAEPSLEKFRAIAGCTGEPFADTSIIPMYFIAEFARRWVTVTLSGDGADEIFAGYETYAADRVHNFARHVPAALISNIETLYGRLFPRDFRKVSLDYKILKFLKGANLPPMYAHFSWRELFSVSELRSMLQPSLISMIDESFPLEVFERYRREVAQCDYIDQALYVDTKTWLPDDILVKVDRATMAHGLEARCPYLDHRLVEFAASLPSALKLRNLTTKYILRRALSSLLPRPVLTRKKRGFNAPISQWLFGVMKGMCDDIMKSSHLFDYVRREMVATLLENHFARRADNSFRIFALVNLHLWLSARRMEKTTGTT